MNPGFNFMTMICERRQCLIHGSNKKDRSGSLLTPLFKHFGIDLCKYSVNKEVQFLDIKYLMACHIMRDEETYNFFDKAGTQLFTKLPHPEITRFSVFDNIRFLFHLSSFALIHVLQHLTRTWKMLRTSPQKMNRHTTSESWLMLPMIRLTDAGWLTRSGRTTASCGGSSISSLEAALAEVTSDNLQKSRLHDRTDQERRLWEQALRPRRFIARAIDVRLIPPRAASPTESARTILYPLFYPFELFIFTDLSSDERPTLGPGTPSDLSHLILQKLSSDQNFGFKTDLQREQDHDSGLF
ncbi:hypothetical protein F2Q68_00035347 [Brassica cretica]|uniref:Arabidopsis retrotransposon Orf1 C-terminal domain-containing protein n=1 Tax=Brassica cretica TaxID=69181 RepID=A0A8S9H010_BRACR|nr:hypothetical protein F2Q68_00035347 [Brassica cretica]